MPDPYPARDKHDKRSLLQKIAEFIHPSPDNTAELIETLAQAEHNQVIGTESRVMLEGVIRLANMTAKPTRAKARIRKFQNGGRAKNMPQYEVNDPFPGSPLYFMSVM